MTLRDLIREHTHDIETALQGLRSTQESLLNQKGAAEDRLKRTQTEITRQRALESERRRQLREAESQVADVQRELEEVERQLEEIKRRHAELVERLFEKRHNRDGVRGLVREASEGIEAARAEAKDEERSSDNLVHRLEGIEADRQRLEVRLAELRRRGLDAFLAQSAARIEQSFATQEEQQRRAALAEKLRKARHDDPVVGDLCDQRDQLLELVQSATVPAVKNLLDKALQEVEKQLEERFPGALAASGVVSAEHPIEELYYFRDSFGKGHLLLPVTEAAWLAVERGETGRSADVLIHLARALVHEVGFRPSDGQFRFAGGRCSFTGQFDTDLLATERFKVPISESGTLIFILCELPTEIQEALAYENAHT